MVAAIDLFKPTWEQHEAAILTEHSERILYVEHGRCPIHESVAIRKWDIVRRKWSLKKKDCHMCKREWEDMFAERFGYRPPSLSMSAGTALNNTISDPTVQVPEMATTHPVKKSVNTNEKPRKIRPLPCVYLNPLRGMQTPHDISQKVKEVRKARLPSDTAVRLEDLSVYARNREDQESIGQAGGIDVILKAMKDFEMNEAVQAAGCLAMSHLSSHPNNPCIIDKRNGIKHVLNAMQRYSSSAQIQLRGCIFISNMRSHGYAGQVLADGGVFIALNTALGSPGRNPETMSHAKANIAGLRRLEQSLVYNLKTNS